MLHNINLTIETAVANQSGAMEADTISKHGRFPKSQMNRIKIMYLISFCYGLIFSIGNVFAQGNDDILVQEFEKRMIERGFIKKIIVYESFTEQQQKNIDNVTQKYLWHVGIWLNYEKQIVSIRTEGNNWNTIEIPFEKILDVRDDVSGYTKTVIREGVFQWHVNSQGYCTDFYLQILTADANKGVQPYYVKLYDPSISLFGRIRENSSEFQALQACANRIIAEMNYVKTMPKLYSSTTRSIQSVTMSKAFTTTLFSQGHKVFTVSSVSGSNMKLKNKEVRAMMMNNPEALRLFKKSKALNLIGNTCFYSGLTVFAGAYMSIDKEKQTSDEMAKLRTIGAVGSAVAMTGMGIALLSYSPLKKSIKTHNNISYGSVMELQFGITGNSVAVVLNF